MTTTKVRVPGALLVTLLSACGSTANPRHDAGDGSDQSSDGQGNNDGNQEGAPDVNQDSGADAPPPHGYSLPEFPGGETFYIRLPPQFSLFLPLYGDEATREPPGFHDPASAYYFSYGFIWWLTGTPDLSTAALRADLRDYYTGLCNLTVAAAVTLDELADAPDAGTLAARRNGTLGADRCFGMPVPAAAVEVSTYNCPDHAAVIVLVSGQPTWSEVWTDLRNLRDGFTCW